MSKIELLAPAGNLETLKGAINAGADAIYFGGKNFNARTYTTNFELEELQEGVTFIHQRERKAFLTLNTMVSPLDLKEYLAFIDKIVKIGFDALIVGNIAIINYIHQTYPEVEIHASTQLSANSIEKVSKLAALGCKRVILARETTLEQLKAIRKENICEIEIFVHGAQCYCVSGKCLFSGLEIGKSSNRGKCVQPCRDYYSLFNGNTLLDKGYLLSMKDLCTIENIDTFLPYVDSLKIEGRRRKKEYVINTVLAYRNKIDNNVKPNIDNLKVSFNREFSGGWIQNDNPFNKVNKVAANHQGILIGTVINVSSYSCYIQLTNTIRIGDGFRIVWDNESYGNILDYFQINGVSARVGNATNVIKIATLKQVAKGARFYKTLDVDLDKSTSPYFEDNYPLVSVDGYVKAKLGQELSIGFKLNGKEYFKKGDIVAKSNNKPTNSEDIKKAIGILGNTYLKLDSLSIELDNNVFVNNTQLKSIRRELIDLILNRDINPKSLVHNNFSYTLLPKVQVSSKIVAKVRNQEQYDTLVDLNCELIYYPLNEVIPSRLTDRSYLSNREEDKGIELTKLVSSYSSNTLLDIDIDQYLNVNNNIDIDFYRKQQANTIYLSPELSDNEIKEILENCKAIYGVTNYKLGVVVYGSRELMISRNSVLNVEENEIFNLKNSTTTYSYYKSDGLYYVIDKPNFHYKDIQNTLIKYGITRRLDFYFEDKNQVTNIFNSYQTSND